MRNRLPDEQSTAVVETIVGVSLKVEGDLKSQGDIRIDGEVRGSITTDGAVLIGTSAKVFANVKAASAEVAGHVEGDINVTKRIALAESARVKGNLTCTELVIAQGAQFTGQSSMSTEEPAAGPAVQVPTELRAKAAASA
ncbi:MAG: polymer-forming cytoskeletal protein [Candidatus Andersenbacteria bacterium]